MITKQAAIYSFWSSFGIPAYNEASVPPAAENPQNKYLTYQYVESPSLSPSYMSASLFYRSKSWIAINEKAEEISEAIGLGGKVLDFDGGKILILKGKPFSQSMSDFDDDQIRRILLNIEAVYFDTH